MKIFIIRHGETEKNKKNVLHEKYDTASLSDLGREQIKLTANILKNEDIAQIFFSNEARAKESAQIISNTLDCLSTNLEGVEERNWGIYSNKPWSEVAVVLNPLSFEERFEYIPEGGESWKAFENRLVAALNHAISVSKGKNIAIVTHGGAIRALMPYLLDVDRKESYKYDPANASITEFEYEEGKFSPIKVDDISHLHKI